MRELLRLIAQRLKPLEVRLENMLARGVIEIVKSAGKLQLVQVTILADETLDDVEHFEPFGFTSRAPAGAEAILASIGGRRGHPVALVITDRRFRPAGLEEGESALYDKTGTIILCKADGSVEIVPSNGQMTFDGDVQVTGTLTATTDVIGGGISLKNHTHPFTDVDTAAGGAGGPSETDPPT